MIEELVGQLMKSGAGGELLQQLQAKGLTANQATQAVSATAEGAMAQAGSGGLASLAGSLLGGSGGGGLASLAGGLLGGSAPQAAAGGDTLAAMAPAVAQFVAQKTGLDPAMAKTIVTLALPKVLELVRSQTGGSEGLGGALKGLFS